MARKFTEEEFIEKANKVHDNFYRYPNFEYINSYTKGWITCPIHGDFQQTPQSHLNGRGCPKCKGEKNSKIHRISDEEVFAKANKVHNNFYDYSKSEYVNMSTKMCITCPIHGDFQQTPQGHLNGHGCPKCRYEKHSKKLQRNFVTYQEAKTRVQEKGIKTSKEFKEWIKKRANNGHTISSRKSV